MCEITLTYPVSSCTAERSLSDHRRLKIFTRSTITQNSNRIPLKKILNARGKVIDGDKDDAETDILNIWKESVISTETPCMSYLQDCTSAL